MEKFNFKLHDAPQSDSSHRTESRMCEIYGCPRRANFYPNNSLRGICRYHDKKGGASLAYVTMMLKNHAEDFNWYEYVFAATPVDFLIGEIAAKAPEELRVLPNEDFKKYRERIKRHIDLLLIPKSRLQEIMQ